MDAHAFINVGGDEELIISLSPLEALELLASRKGFYDIDVEPDNGRVKITASAHKRTVSAWGRTLREACSTLARSIYE